MDREPTVSVGIMDRQAEVRGRLDGAFACGGRTVTGEFRAYGREGKVVLADATDRELARSDSIRLEPEGDSVFTLFGVSIGKQFHWERPEDQVFRGSFLLRVREDNSLAAINEAPVEEYLRSVVSSEMSATAPIEFLKAHAVLSRSWLLCALARKGRAGDQAAPIPAAGDGGEEVVRWYEREDHDIFDVCADDHCQRYQGITKISSGRPEEAVRETRGMVLTYNDEICDARYAKACGGLTEQFDSAWADDDVPYLKSISDGPRNYGPIRSEAEAAAWIKASPEAYCNAADPDLLARILPDFDRETKGFFRWQVEYSRDELSDIVRERSGIDFGTLKAIEPLRRGPSGRITRLRITGSKRTVIVGKELEIRRWLSKSHLYSSAFIVETGLDGRGEIEGFSFRGAGWGHGVGLCQIGAAVMASRGFSAEAILSHYFAGVAISKIY